MPENPIASAVPAQAPLLRVGLLLDALVIPAWMHRMLELVRREGHAEIVLAICRGSNAMQSRAASGSTGRGQPLAHRARELAAKWLVGKPGGLPDANATLDASALLADIKVVNTSPRKHGETESIEGEALAEARAQRIDVFLQLGFGDLGGEILDCARYGIWYCAVGDVVAKGLGAVGVREVMESRNETRSTLEVIIPRSGQALQVYESFSSTNPMSIADNSSTVLWKSLHFFPRVLQRLRMDGEDAFFANAHSLEGGMKYGRARSGDQGRILAELPVATFLRKALEKVRRKVVSRRYVRQWSLLYAYGEDLSLSLGQFEHLVPPIDRFWADPFVVERDGRHYIFVEECPYATRKGHISVIVLQAGSRYGSPVRVIDAPYHLSYPYLFEHAGNLYMIPESAANRTIDLYKCTAFPFRWEFQKHLFENIQAVDTTLFLWQGRWWMFVNQAETRGASTWDELFLYFSDDPVDGQWMPHPRNPVVSDVRSARPAGKVFTRNGRIYRPSQNCGKHYGYGFNICEITSLSETEYQERIVQKVEPGWDANVVSTHTINYASGLTVADCQLMRRT